MTYRRASAPAPADDAEAQLARLAEEGRRRQTGLAIRESRARDEIARVSRAPSSRMFRARFAETHVRPAVAIVACTMTASMVATFVLASSAGEVAWGILMTASVFGWVGVPIWWVVRWFLVRRDVARVLAWHEQLPFPFPSFVPALSSSGFIRAGSMVARFASTPSFDAELVRGLLGFTSTPRAEVVLEDRELRLQGSPDLAFGRWTREVVEKVLLPLHATLAVEEAELRVEIVTALANTD